MGAGLSNGDTIGEDGGMATGSMGGVSNGDADGENGGGCAGTGEGCAGRGEVLSSAEVSRRPSYTSSSPEFVSWEHWLHVRELVADVSRHLRSVATTPLHPPRHDQ
jgi:hypothetical protein